MTQPVATLNPQVIGQTERALGALLAPVLARSATTFHHWMVLTLTSAEGGVTDRALVVERMVQARKIPVAEAAAAVDELTAAGLVAELPGEPGRVRLTPPGQAKFREIRAAIDEVAARVWGALPAADMEIAGRLLTTITDRANAELARA